MEIVVERQSGSSWRAVDPGLVLNSGDGVRFRVRTNFDGFLYVTNLSTSGQYSVLFPGADTGRSNRVKSGVEYTVPATQALFRIAGPAGHETMYWLMSPVAINAGDGKQLPGPPATEQSPPADMTPRCDDSILRARGDCFDAGAGARELTVVPKHLADAQASPNDLMFLREKNKSVVSSPTPLNGPVIYEFRLAHK